VFMRVPKGFSGFVHHPVHQTDFDFGFALILNPHHLQVRTVTA